MDNVETIKIKREPNWLPPFRIEYDGKYVTLFGGDREYEVYNYGRTAREPEYEEMVLIPVIVERRNIIPSIEEVTDMAIEIRLSKAKE